MCGSHKIKDKLAILENKICFYANRCLFSLESDSTFMIFNRLVQKNYNNLSKKYFSEILGVFYVLLVRFHKSGLCIVNIFFIEKNGN